VSGRKAIVLLSIALGCSSSLPAPAPANAPPVTRSTASTAPTRSFRVEITGHGPPMLFVPGLASSGETWTDTVAHFGATHTCYVLTLAGFAGVPPIKEPLVASVVSELAAYIAANHLEHPIVVGHSLGGEVALALASAYPDRVGALVIVDSLPFLGALVGAATAAEAAPVATQMHAMISGQTDAQYQAYVTAGTSTRSMVTSEPNQARLVRWSLASDRTSVLDAMTELFVMDLRPQLARIEVPTLVIGTWVGWDRPGAPADRAATETRFRDQYKTLAQLHFVMAATRHFVMFDDLPWFLGQLDGFLGDPSAAVRERGFSG
jgi:N-formylmaleamate deformylase